MGVPRLCTAAAAAAIVLTVAPPVLAEPEVRPGQLVTVAGIGDGGFSGDGGAARQARIGFEIDVAVAKNGVVYIADQYNEVLRVVGTDGVISSIPLGGEDDFVEPVAVAITPAGVLYVATRSDVRRMNPDGGFTVVAGGGRERFDNGGDGGDGGPATEAYLYLLDVAVAGDGTLYLADWASKRLRRVAQDGTITTVATTADVAEVAVGRNGTIFFTVPNARVVQKLGPDGTVAVVLGQQTEEGFSGDGGPAAEAKFQTIGGIATDEAGNLYVADSNNGNIRVIDESGVIDTIGPSIHGLRDVTFGPNGDLYLALDAKVVRLVRDADEPATGTVKPGPARWHDQEPGTILPVVGAGREMTESEEVDGGASGIAVGKDGTLYYTSNSEGKVFAIGKDGAAKKTVKAEVNHPGALATDQAGNVYVAKESDYQISKIDANGTVTTIAGTGDIASDPDAPRGDGGPATAAPIGAVGPAGLATGPDGSVYVGERSAGSRIRKIDPQGIITTLVGDLRDIAAVAVDASGTVYFSSAGQVYTATADGVVTPLAGTDTEGFSGDGGPATQARVNWPGGLAVGMDGTRYLADTDNNRVRAVRADGTITTVAGTGDMADDGDGGPATKAALEAPERIAADDAGNLYVTTAGGASIRKIDSKGTITTVARLGLVVDPDASKAVLESSSAVCVDAAGTVSASGTNLVLAAPAAGKASMLTELHPVDALAAGPDGSVYVVSNNRVERFYPDGVRVTVAGGGAELGVGRDEPLPDADGKRATSTVLDPTDVAVGPDGELYLTSGSRVYRLNRDGTLSSIVDMKDAAGFKDGEEYFLSIAVRHDGVLYVAEPESHRVFVVRDGEVRTFAGTGVPGHSDERGDGDKATEAPVASPGDLAVARDGTVYVTTSFGIRRIVPDGEIDTVVENLPTRNSLKISPSAIALDSHGNLYFTASELHQVRVVVRPGEMPHSFPWAVIWIGLLVVGVVGYVVFAVVQRKVKKTQPASSDPA